MKYIAGLALAALIGNEIFTLLVLTVLMFLFFGDLWKARFQ